GLAALNSVGEPLRTLVHVLETGRIGQEIANARIAVAGEVLTGDAARHQQFVDQRVEAGRGLGRAAPAPRLAADRVFDVQRETHTSETSSSPRNWRAMSLGIAGI